MGRKSLDELEKEILELYDNETDVEEIVRLTNEPRYLIESILISKRNVYFR